MHSKSKGFAQIVLILILLILVGATAYYFGTTKRSHLNVTGTPIESTPTPKPSLLNIPSTTLSTDWTYKSDACNVKFPIPPKTAPYYQVVNPNRQYSVTNEEGSGRFWDFPRGGTYPNMISKLLTGNAGYKQSSAMYAATDEASGYISQAVSVSCIPNNGRFIDNESLIAAISKELDKYNALGQPQGMEASSYKIKSVTPSTRWNKNVLDIVVTEVYGITVDVKYTLLVTPQFVYEVKVFGETGDNFVKQTAQKIFDGLVFE